MSNPITDQARKASDFAGEKIDAATEQVRETTAAAREIVNDALETTKIKATEAYEASRAKAEAAYAASRAKASQTIDSAKTSAAKVTARAGEELGNNPLAFVLGGLAVGAVIGALLPRTEREDKLLGTTGDKIKTTAVNAAKAARVEGGKKLEAMGVSTVAAKAQIDQLLSTVSKAATEASSAAGKAAAKVAKKP